MAREPQIFKDHLSLIVLSVLRSGSMYGYELVQAVKARSDNALDLREGVVYPLLHRLVADGLLASQWGDSEKGPRRRYYSLTAKGRSVREQQADQWHAFAGAVNRVIGGEPCVA